MKTWLTSLFLLGAMSAPSFAQQPQSTEKTPGELVEQLGADEFTARRDAEIELEKLGTKGVDALKKAAKDHDDPEVQWRAKRLLERVQNDSATAKEKTDDWTLPPLWKPRDLSSMFGSVFDRLEDDFGFDVPRRSFFNDSFFGDLREQMKSLEERLRDAGDTGAGINGKSQGLQMRVGPDGVRVEVREEDESGESTVRTYEAPDLDTFRDKYPEVAKQYLGRDGEAFTWRLDPKEFFSGLPILGFPADATADQGRALGVSVRSIGSDLRAFLGIDDARGLLVEEVMPDSLASKLKIEPRDVILDVEGKAVGSVRDVRRALKAADSSVEVCVNRKGSELTLKAEHDWAAATAKDDSGD